MFCVFLSLRQAAMQEEGTDDKVVAKAEKASVGSVSEHAGPGCSAGSQEHQRIFVRCRDFALMFMTASRPDVGSKLEAIRSRCIFRQEFRKCACIYLHGVVFDIQTPPYTNHGPGLVSGAI